MKVLAIGDPHLGDHEKMVNRFHYPTDYFEQVTRNIEAESPPADLLLVAGDLVWSNELTYGLEGLRPIQDIQVPNISFVEGNHDWPWLPELSKMYELYDSPEFYFVSGRVFVLDRVGVCGVCGADRESTRKSRELQVLKKALNELSRVDIDVGICLMHFPPSSHIFKNPEEAFAEDEFFSLIEESGIINKVVYGHIHKDQIFKVSLYLKVDGIELYNTAIDYHDWQPVRIV